MEKMKKKIYKQKLSVIKYNMSETELIKSVSTSTLTTDSDTSSVISNASKKSNGSIIIRKKSKKSKDPSLIPTENIPETIDLTLIYTMLKSIRDDIDNMKSDIKFLKKKKERQITEFNCKRTEIKKEILDVPVKIAMKCLEYKSIKGDMELFKYCYVNKDDKVKVPITVPHPNIYKYWHENEWKMDVEGTHIKDVLFYNFKKIYIKTNRMENYPNKKLDTTRFTENQKYIIDTLASTAYQTRFMKALKNYIKEI